MLTFNSIDTSTSVALVPAVSHTEKSVENQDLLPKRCWLDGLESMSALAVLRNDVQSGEGCCFLIYAKW
jgi:hypothetical protein